MHCIVEISSFHGGFNKGIFFYKKLYFVRSSPYAFAVDIFICFITLFKENLVKNITPKKYSVTNTKNLLFY